MESRDTVFGVEHFSIEESDYEHYEVVELKVLQVHSNGHIRTSQSYSTGGMTEFEALTECDERNRDLVQHFEREIYLLSNRIFEDTSRRAKILYETNMHRIDTWEQYELASNEASDLVFRDPVSDSPEGIRLTELVSMIKAWEDLQAVQVGDTFGGIYRARRIS